MSQQSQSAKWTVEHETNVVPFINFTCALSYADGLVARRPWVKVINPSKNTIKIMEDSHRLALPEEAEHLPLSDYEANGEMKLIPRKLV